MKRISALIAISMVVLFSSCGSEPAKEETKAADTTAAVTPPPGEVKPAFVPFKIFMIMHKVKNFDKWKVGYLAHDSVRLANGLTQLQLGRALKDTNMVYIVEKMDDLAKTQAFTKSPGLKDAMKKAGVTSDPGFSYAIMVRGDDSPVPTDLRVGVAHHVKNFDAWLKVYDAEGPATRAANGMIDRGIARSLIDSNMVYLTFAVTDTAKARARFASPDLKKIMTDAGVDSPPTTRWFRVVQ